MCGPLRMETEMNRIADDQLELKFDADEASMRVREAQAVSLPVGAQVVCLSSHLARKATSRDSVSAGSNGDLALIDRIANRVRFF